MMPSLQTNRLTLRQLTAADWEPYRDFYMSKRARAVGGPDNLGKAWRIFAAQLGQWQIHGFGMWAITLKDADTAVGIVGAWFPADWPEKEIGWMIFADHLEGKGIAHEAATAAIAHAYQTLGWKTAVSYIAPDNNRSIALAERLGAQLDPDARIPRPESPCLVYRHPAPGAST